MVAFDFDILQGYHLAKPLTEKDFLSSVLDQEIARHGDPMADQVTEGLKESRTRI